MMSSKRGKAAAWLHGFAAGYRGHPMHVPAGFDVRRWLDGWREGRELRRAMSVSWREAA
jgi:hypothetical protein